MTIPYMLYAGATSTDPDYVPLVSKKQALLADARITRWFAARDGEVTLSGTDATRITQMIDRKGGTAAAGLASDATRPVLTSPTGYGTRKAVSFVDAASDRSLAIADLDLSGPYFIALVCAKSTTTGETFFNQAVGQTTSQVSVAGVTSGTAPNASLFQHFRGTSGVNIPAGVNGLDTAPHLVLASYDGTSVQGALGRGAVVSTAPVGSPAAAGSPARLGRSLSTTPAILGGSIAQIIFGNVGIFAAGNADLREMICGYMSDYYGFSV